MKSDIAKASLGTFPIPSEMDLTAKPDGSVCAVVEGRLSEDKDGNSTLNVTKITPYADYKPKKGDPASEDETPAEDAASGEEAEPPAKKPGKKMPARLAAVMGKDEGMGY